jgi:hypothetical protein
MCGHGKISVPELEAVLREIVHDTPQFYFFDLSTDRVMEKEFTVKYNSADGRNRTYACATISFAGNMFIDPVRMRQTVTYYFGNRADLNLKY